MNSTMKSTLKHSTKVAGAVVICTALIAGCSAQPAAQPTAANAAESQLKVVKVSPVEKKKIGDPLEQVADVVASVQMDVITKVNGDVLEILKKTRRCGREGRCAVPP